MTILKNNSTINELEIQVNIKKNQILTTFKQQVEVPTSKLFKGKCILKCKKKEKKEKEKEKEKNEIVIPKNIEHQSKNNWNSLIDKMNSSGFTKSAIIDIESGDCHSGLTIVYNEYIELINTLNGISNPINLFIDSERYYIVNSNDIYISGRSPNFSFILRKTNSKFIIGIFDMHILEVNVANKVIGDIYTTITTNDKTEIVSNLIQ